MSKKNKVDGKLVYPPGVRDITEDISTDDLVRRLKDCALAFQSMSQDDDNSAYIPLALHLATEYYIEHNSKDVRLLTACCVADVFRVYAPDAPYKDPDQLKVIFEFFIDQLKGLENPNDPIFKRYFYLLENLAWVKTFNICVELEDNQKILCRLFKLMFSIVSDSHSAKVKKFMLDMLSPLISEADVVSQDLLDIILLQIIEPIKSENKNACTLAQDILKRTAGIIEPYIQGFFNNALILGKTSQSEVSKCLYELIYELNNICPSMLVAVLPQLEFKLKSNEEKERIEVTRVLAKMFSDKNSNLVEQNTPLWKCFLGRFNDISAEVRKRCVQCTALFLLNRPDLRDEMTEQLKQRQHDLEEHVRYEVVMTVISSAKKDLTCVNEEMLNFVKERTLDKKFRVRKEALLGLAVLHKQYVNSPDISLATRESISWIKNKVLHAYYQPSVEDRLLVERLLHTCLVPYQSPMEERMKKLYQLYVTVDDHAIKAIREILRCQSIVRNHMKDLLEIIQCDKSDNRREKIFLTVTKIAKNLQDPAKSQDHLLKFSSELESNLRLRNMMSLILTGNVSCSDAEHNVRGILKALGLPVQTNTYYMIMKQVLERVAPIMLDKDGIRQLVYFVKDSLLDTGAVEAELSLNNSSHRGLHLLYILSFFFPVAFQREEIFNDLLLFLQAEDEISVDMTLQILINLCSDIERTFPDITLKLIPLLESFAEMGTVKQAKHAIYCLNGFVSDKETIFGLLIENLKKHFTLESQYFQTALVSVGHIAFLSHNMFAPQLKSIVGKVVVKELLMLDQDLPRGGDNEWGPLKSLPDETKVKIEGMKLMVRWLMGLKNSVQPAVSTIRLLNTVIVHGGDLMQRQHTAPLENSWLRFTAASCMLKLCQETSYVETVTLEQFQVLASVMNDPCLQVRELFAQKLHKGLLYLKLPLEFLSIFALCGVDENNELKTQIKAYILANVNKRREYLKQHPLTSKKLMLTYLPDYVIPYAIHLLAHALFLEAHDDVPSLLKVKDCLWILMEPLMTKNENYSYSFFKCLIESIKQTKDKQSLDDDAANLKLYAVCDLALGLVLSKKSSFILKDFPVEPSLPTKLYTSPDKNFSNLKSYLPPELASHPQKNSGFEMDIFTMPIKPNKSTVGAKKTADTRQPSKLKSVTGGSSTSSGSPSCDAQNENSQESSESESNSTNDINQETENLVPGAQEKSPRTRVRPRIFEASTEGKIDSVSQRKLIPQRGKELKEKQRKLPSESDSSEKIVLLSPVRSLRHSSNTSTPRGSPKTTLVPLISSPRVKRINTRVASKHQQSHSASIQSSNSSVEHSHQSLAVCLSESTSSSNQTILVPTNSKTQKLPIKRSHKKKVPVSDTDSRIRDNNVSLMRESLNCDSDLSEQVSEESTNRGGKEQNQIKLPIKRSHKKIVPVSVTDSRIRDSSVTLTRSSLSCDSDLLEQISEESSNRGKKRQNQEKLPVKRSLKKKVPVSDTDSRIRDSSVSLTRASLNCDSDLSEQISEESTNRTKKKQNQEKLPIKKSHKKKVPVSDIDIRIRDSSVLLTRASLNCVSDLSEQISEESTNRGEKKQDQEKLPIKKSHKKKVPMSDTDSKIRDSSVSLTRVSLNCDSDLSEQISEESNNWEKKKPNQVNSRILKMAHSGVKSYKTRLRKGAVSKKTSDIMSSDHFSTDSSTDETGSKFKKVDNSVSSTVSNRYENSKVEKGQDATNKRKRLVTRSKSEEQVSDLVSPAKKIRIMTKADKAVISPKVAKRVNNSPAKLQPKPIGAQKTNKAGTETRKASPLKQVKPKQLQKRNSLSDSSSSTSTPKRLHNLRKAVTSSLSNGTRSSSSQEKNSPSKNRLTATSLLAKAVRSSRHRTNTRSEVRQVNKKR